MWAVYHLHGRTGRFTVWVNHNKNSELVNFAPESRLKCVKINSNSNRPFPHSCKQRYQFEARVDKIQWFVWNCPPEPRLHFFMFAHWSVMRERSITEKRPRKTETAKIPEGNFEEMEHEYPFGTFRKRVLTFHMFRCSRKFSAGTTPKGPFLFTFQLYFLETFSKW